MAYIWPSMTGHLPEVGGAWMGSGAGEWSLSLHTRGDDLVATMPGCVCPKVKDMGHFLASKE